MEELPKKRVKTSQIDEAELWSSFFLPVLTKVLSDNERNIRPSQPDKAAAERRHSRPDAIISEVNNGEFGVSLGFGECKTAISCTNASLCKDVIKLTQLAQRSININNIKSVFCFQIHGTYTITTQYILDKY